MITLTPRQFETLRFIAEFRDGNGWSPTQKEIATFLGVSTQTAREHVLALKIADALRSNSWGAPRDIYLSEEGRAVLDGAGGRCVG